VVRDKNNHFIGKMAGRRAGVPSNGKPGKRKRDQAAIYPDNLAGMIWGDLARKRRGPVHCEINV
jgi:hypothetical protein